MLHIWIGEYERRRVSWLKTAGECTGKFLNVASHSSGEPSTRENQMEWKGYFEADHIDIFI